MLLHDAAGRARACAALRLRLGSPGHAATRAREYRERLQAHLRAHEDRLVERGPRPHRPQPAARVRRRPPRHAGGHGDAPLLLDSLDADDAEHFDEVRALLDAAGVDYELDPTLVRGLDYYTRTVFEFTSDALGAQSRRRRRRALRRARSSSSAARRRPGMGWAAGIERMLLAAERPARAPSRSPTSSSPDGDRGGRGLRARRRGARAPGSRVQQELAGRSLKGQLKHADRAGARYVAIVGDGRHRS